MRQSRSYGSVRGGGGNVPAYSAAALLVASSSGRSSMGGRRENCRDRRLAPWALIIRQGVDSLNNRGADCFRNCRHTSDKTARKRLMRWRRRCRARGGARVTSVDLASCQWEDAAMQRFRAYDPPEYVNWQADPAVTAEFREQIHANQSRRRIVDGLRLEQHLDLYRGLVRNRLHDVQLKRWVMQGVISKAWLGTGEEAATVGAVHALRRGGGRHVTDCVGPMIRNAGACHEMGMPLADLFRAYLGTADTILKGRDLHIGDLEKGVMAPISMVASLVPVCAGLALGFKQRREDRLALTWVGDGAARTGEFHEGMSMAAALGVPLIVILQNNQIALGTRLEAHSRTTLEAVARAYVKDHPFTCHGNNVLDVLAATTLAARQCRAGRGPVIIVAETGRMGGHATHDEGEARSLLPAEHFAYWGARDPVGLFESYQVEMFTEKTGGKIRSQLEAIEAEVTQEVEAAATQALASRDTAVPSADSVAEGVYAAMPDDARAPGNTADTVAPGASTMTHNSPQQSAQPTSR